MEAYLKSRQVRVEVILDKVEAVLDTVREVLVQLAKLALGLQEREGSGDIGCDTWK